jgi:hypothetical protein
LLGALSADELEKLFWRLVAYVAYAITDREIETAALAIELWRAAGVIQAGPECHGPRLMWREGSALSPATEEWRADAQARFGGVPADRKERPYVDPRQAPPELR